MDGMPSRDLTHLDDAVADLRAASLSSRTIAEYEKQWRGVQSWCQVMGVRSLPMSSQDLARHLAAVADDYSVSTLAQRVAAINAAHRIAGLPAPGNDPMVSQVLAGLRHRRRAVPRRRAKALSLEHVRVLVSSLDQQTVTWPDAVAAHRDTALVLLGWTAALRRSEIVDLDWRHLSVETSADSVHLRVRIDYSKTDQHGDGDTLAIPSGSHRLTCTPCAMHRWAHLVRTTSRPEAMSAVWDARSSSRAADAHHCGLSDESWAQATNGLDGPVFRSVTASGAISDRRLAGSSVGSILVRRAEQAGLSTTKLSAHSLRAGFITEADASGADLAAIMRQSRHRRPETVLGYIRHSNPLAGNAVTSLDL